MVVPGTMARCNRAGILFPDPVLADEITTAILVKKKKENERKLPDYAIAMTGSSITL